MSIKLNYQNAGLRNHELEYVRPLAEAAFGTLTRHTGPGHEMLGWLELPYTYDKEEFARIKAAAKRIQERSQVLVVIGIGGSYLGARAGLEFVKGPFGNQLREKGVEVYFAGSNLSADYMQDIVNFDQPGVEAYKKNMFALLGKPGYEDMREALEARLKL